MKKKILLAIVIMAVLTCLFAIGVCAAEPNYNGEKVTLKDGTVCPLYDTDGNAISWYVKSETENGVREYGWASVLTGLNIVCTSGTHELNDVNVTVDGVTYPNTSMVVINMRNEVITSDRNKGNTPTYIYRPFRDCKKLEYIYYHVDTTEFAGETMVGCENLQYINFEELTKLTYIGNQALNGCTSLFRGKTMDLSKTSLKSTGTNSLRNTGAQAVIFPTTFESMGQETFRDCAYLTKVTFTATPTSINTYWTFYKCGELTEVVGAADCFKNITSFTQSMFYECKKLTKVEGLIENGVLTLSSSCTKLGASTFRETGGFESVVIPASVASIEGTVFYQSPSLKTVVFENVGTDISFGDDIFKNADALETVTFNKNAGITTLGVFMFYDCDNLKYLSIPDSVTRLKTSAFHANDKLTAVYLPANLTTIDKLDNLFESCPNMYFVNEFFTDPAKVEKPSVYYFPNIITEISQYTEIFKNCAYLNETIVFGDQLTAVKDGFAFGKYDSKAPANNFVFLGNVTEFTYYGGYFYNTNIYFCNPNTTVESLKVSPYSGSSGSTNCKVFVCASGKWADLSTREFTNEMTTDNHVRNPQADVTSEATCTLPAGSFTYCFCNTLISSNVTPGSVALGHIKGENVLIHYPIGENGVTDFFKNAIHSYTCTRDNCGQKVNEEKAESALFTEKGYSKETFEGGAAFTYGIKLNKDAEKAYIANGNTVSYGFIIGAETEEGTSGNIMNADGTTNLQKYVLTDFAESDYKNFSIYNVTLYGLKEEQQKKQSVYCNAYVIANGEVYYIGKNVTKSAVMISYEDING